MIPWSIGLYSVRSIADELTFFLHVFVEVAGVEFVFNCRLDRRLEGLRFHRLPVNAGEPGVILYVRCVRVTDSLRRVFGKALVIEPLK